MQSNEMKLYVGFLALTNVLRVRVKTGNAENKKRASIFIEALIFGSNDLWNGAFFKRLEQPSETKQSKGMRPLDCPLNSITLCLV